jgi:hypothetical protein
MDLVNSVINFQQSALASQIQFAVAKKVLDNQKFQGNAALQLIQAASGTAAKAGDELVAAATGLGRQLDIQA